MMRRQGIQILCALFIALMPFLTCTAQVPHLYVAGMLQWNEPVSSFSKESFDQGNGNAKTGGGAELDVGLMSDFGSTYIGFRWAQFGERSGSWEWREMNRFVAGLRWHMAGKLITPVVPVLGVGISLGETKLGWSKLGTAAVIGSATSQTSVGWFVEGGVRVKLPGALSALGALQYQQFDANFEDAFFGNDDSEFDITFITTQVGLQYTL